MTTALYIKLIIYTTLFFLFVNLTRLHTNKVYSKHTRAVLLITEAIEMMAVAMALIAFDDRQVWAHEYFFGALYVTLVPDVLTGLIFLIDSFIHKDKDRRVLQHIVAAIATIAFLCYNVINMQTIIPKYHEIKSSKLRNEYKMVFFADLHYGSAQGKETVDKALEEIAQLKPDFLLLGGDIVDEHTTKQEMEYIFQKIASLGIDTYYIYGNHDRQDQYYRVGGRKYSEKELEDAIIRNNIRILYEDYVEINDDLIIVGREDVSRPDKRKAVKDLPEYKDGSYVIVLDHTPYQNEEIIELQADLQLSGHTHAAQFFPAKTIYKILGLNVYGDYYIGDTHLYVSSGIAGWYLPLRSEEHCNYEVIELRPE